MKLSHKLKDKLKGLSPKNKINAVLEKYSDLINCANLPENAKICFIDDQYHPLMKGNHP